MIADAPTNVVPLFDPAGSPLRTPPANDRAEQAFLGALLANNRVLEKVADFLHPKHFAWPVNGRIYATASAIIVAGGIADPVTLRDKFANTGALDEMGGLPYLAQLLTAMVGVINAPEYAKAIVETWKRREIIEAARSMADAAYDGEHDSRAITETALDRLDKVTSGHGDTSSLVTMDDAVKTAVISATAAVHRGRGTGLSTGMLKCDEIMGGLRPKKLTLMGGVEGIGKAQPLDALVLLADGYFVPMGDLRHGDALASVDGLPSTVSMIHPRKQRQVFRVTFSDNRSTRVCADHLWRVSSPFWPMPRVIDTTEVRRLLTLRSYAGALRIQQVNGVFGSGDFVLPPYDVGASAHVDPERPVPAAYLSGTRSDRLDLLRGLIEAGSTNTVQGDVVYHAPTAYLADVVRDLSRSLGCTCRLYVSDDGTQRSCRIGAVDPVSMFGRSTVRELQLRPTSGSALLSFRSIEPDGLALTQCITVSHTSHLYVTDGYIVTHNSALGWQWTMHVAKQMREERAAGREWGAVVGFSLEMPAEDLALRAISPLVGISFSSLCSGRSHLQGHETVRRLSVAAEQLSGYPVWLTDGSALSVEMMRLRLRQIKRRYGRIALVTGDHLHIVKDDSTPSRVAQVENIALGFKQMAHEFDCAALVLAQLVKDVSRRDDKRPVRSDIAYGGATHADNIVLVHREEHFLDRAMPLQRKAEPQSAYIARCDDWERMTQEHAGTADLIFDKVRGGSAGLVKANFDGPTTSFSERA